MVTWHAWVAPSVHFTDELVLAGFSVDGLDGSCSPASHAPATTPRPAATSPRAIQLRTLGVGAMDWVIGPGLRTLRTSPAGFRGPVRACRTLAFSAESARRSL